MDTGVTAIPGHMVLGRGRLGRAHPAINWRPAAELPPPDDSSNANAKLERAYVRALKDRDVPTTLDVIVDALATAVASAP